MANRYAEKKYFTCLNCNKENRWKHSSTNKYCNHICAQEGWYKTVTLPLILEGKISVKKSKPSLVRFLTERDGYKCSECNVSEWFGKLMILDIDHVDGNNENDLPNNLRFLCPNCHRMTPTWGNKKRI